MILIDDRVGSRELEQPLKQFGVSVRVRRLEFGDVSFPGCGPGGPARIGIERKTVSDLLSCIADKRFSGHQLPGLLRFYDRVYVIVEGPYKPDPKSGLLLCRERGEWRVARTRLLYAHFDHFLASLVHRAAVTVLRSGGFAETAWLVWSRYEWWQKPWDAHRSIYAVEEAVPDAAIIEPRTFVRSMAAQIPYIGWTRSKWCEDHFDSVHQMVNASIREWREVGGVVRGGTTQHLKTTAVKIYQLLRKRIR